MKNLIGFIALITLLSGCGSGVEHWTCEVGTYRKAIITEDMTIDFENNTWQFFDSRIAPFNEIGDRIFSTYKNDNGKEMTVTLDRDTGEYATGDEDARIILGKCSKK